MTLEQLQQADEQIRNGEITDIGRIKELFAQAVAHEEQLKAEINKRYTLKELKSMYRMYSDAKKAEAVDRAYDDFLMSFNLSGSVSYNPFGGESMKDALKKKVEGQTQEELDEYIERRKTAIEERRKALENPETLSEFQTFIRWKGRSALTEEQNQRLEQLIADQTLEKQKEEAKRRATVSQVNLDGVGMELKETKHTKKGYDLFVVELSDRVDREVFNELKGKAKRLGGWYSSYQGGGAIPGFQFKEKTAAEQFMALQKGDVDRGEQIEEKIQNKQMTVADRFRASADKMEAEGRESLSADRKTNTARRVRMAQSAEADAEGKIWFAKVMRNIAQGIEDGNIKYLSLVDSMVQLTELQSLLNRAHYERMRKEDIRYDLWQDAKDDNKSVEYVKYPIPTYHFERLDRIFATIKNTKGIAMRMKRIGKLMMQAKRQGDHLVKVGYRSEIDDLRRIVERVPDRYDQSYIKDEILRLDRIQRMGLVNLPTLKTALREYIQFKKVDVLSPEEQREKEIRGLEREFVGKKIEGFFPTPRPLAETMVDLLDIQEGDRVCEPSAGLGHLADVATEENPGIDITLIEQYWPLVEALRKKGYEQVVQGDFLEYNERKFDRILMNPPFENLADIDHVRHAYSLLNPDGKLVAIMANNKQGTRQKVREFSEWLDEIGAFVQDNEPGAFQSAFRPTGVNTILVAIDKVEEAAEPVETEAQPPVQVATQEVQPATEPGDELEILKFDLDWIPEPKRGGVYSNPEMERFYHIMSDAVELPNPQSETAARIYEHLKAADEYTRQHFKDDARIERGTILPLKYVESYLFSAVHQPIRSAMQHNSGALMLRENRTRDFVVNHVIEVFKYWVRQANIYAKSMSDPDFWEAPTFSQFIGKYLEYGKMNPTSIGASTNPTTLNVSEVVEYALRKYFGGCYGYFRVSPEAFTEEIKSQISVMNLSYEIRGQGPTLNRLISLALDGKMPANLVGELVDREIQADAEKMFDKFTKDREIVKAAATSLYRAFVEKDYSYTAGNYTKALGNLKGQYDSDTMIDLKGTSRNFGITAKSGWSLVERKVNTLGFLLAAYLETPDDQVRASIEEYAEEKGCFANDYMSADFWKTTPPVQTLKEGYEKYILEEKPTKETNIPMTAQDAINRTMPVVKGKEITLSLPNGEKRRAQFALVELDNTLASHSHKTFASTPGYPTNAQGENINDRNYEDDKAAQARVQEMAKNLDPFQLITTSRTPSGTPIVAGEQVGGEWIVVSGNNRTMSLKLAEREHPEKYEAYVDALREELPAFGIAPDSLNQFGLPFLVRIDYGFPAFQTQELAKYNQSDMKGKRQVDKAIERSNALRENEFCSARIPIMLNNYERMSDFYSDRNAQKEMLDMLIQCNLVTQQSVPEYYDEGYFTSAGKELVESVLAGIVLDKAALKATERDGLKQARRVIVYAIPALMSNNTLKEGSLIKQVNEAILYLNDQKASGLPFDQYINQGALFAEKQYSKEAVYLSRLISMGQRKFKQSILSYNQSLRNSGGAALFEDQAVTPAEAFKAYVIDQIPEAEAKLIEQHSKPAQEANPKPGTRAQAKLKLAKAKKKKKLKLLQLAA
ncbi:methyltransferase [Phaeodactylibacter sp.]|uniref:methyltransferase n=1 Tax=Phaeodactylibacter sp. TaxID=1940289 RepID=UPI0025EEABF1|nr:methyltransferase [Phaeodactylibacter sp.]MCI4650871.1 methyltransferase [Phaeodactylibacter sp.]MCI5089828.1 methyltransferase [Phaeodactylibacter sp.]